MKQETHRAILGQLIRFEKPISELLVTLSHLGNNSEEYLAHLQYDDIIDVLERYLSDEFSVKDIQSWARAIELRDDIEFGYEGDHVFDVIYKLATPELEGALTKNRAQLLVEVLALETPSEHEIDQAYK